MSLRSRLYERSRTLQFLRKQRWLTAVDRMRQLGLSDAQRDPAGLLEHLEQRLLLTSVTDVTLDGNQLTVTYDDKDDINIATAEDLANFGLLGSGGDNIFGNGNDVDQSASLSNANFVFDDGQQGLTFLDFNSLPNDRYQLLIDGVLDGSNNPVDYDPPFEFDQAVTPVRTWIALVDGNWEDAANWQDGNVPQPGEDVVINQVGITVTINSNVDVTSLTSTANLNIASGQLEVHADSTLDGDLTLGSNAGLLAADGATVNINGNALLDGGNLESTGGAVIIVPNVTSYTVPAVFSIDSFIRADGAGSAINLSNLTSITGSESPFAFLVIEAVNGGSIDLSSLGDIQNPASGAGNRRGIQLHSDGAGSAIDVSSLTSFVDGASNSGSELDAINGGTILTGMLTTVTGVELTLDGTGTLPTSQFITFEHSDLNATGGVSVDLSNVISIQQSRLFLSGGSTTDLASVTNIDGASFDVSDGVTLTVPQATTYSLPNAFSIDAFIRANGPGSEILFPMLTAIAGSESAFAFLDVESLNGGLIDLSQVANISVPAAGAGNARGIRFESNGAGSSLDLSALTDFVDEASNGQSNLEVVNGGELKNANVTNLVGVDLILDSTGTISTSQIVSYERGIATVSGGNDLDLSNATSIERATFLLNDGSNVDLSNATNIDGASIEANDGAVVTLSAATSYTIPDVFSLNAFIRANGPGSAVLFPMVSSMTGSGTAFTFLDVEASDGGLIDLAQVTTITEPGSGAGNARGLRFESNGTGSRIDVSNLTSFTDEASNGASQFEVINNGELLNSNVTQLVGVDFILDSTGAVSTTQITDYERGIVTLTGGGDVDFSGATNIQRSSFIVNDGGTVNLDNAVNIDSASFEVNDGATVIVPKATSYFVGDVFAIDAFFRSNGTGSTLLFPMLTSITGSGTAFATLDIESLAGGTIDLSLVTSITVPAAGAGNARGIRMLADGANSLVDLSTLAEFNNAAQNPSSSIQASDAATIDFADSVVFTGAQLTVTDTGTLDLQSLELLSKASISGTGTLIADVTNTAGTIDTNATIGNLIIDGSYVQGAAGTLAVAIGGLTPNIDFDQFVVTQEVTLDGTFDVSIDNSFVPSDGESFVVMTFPSHLGEFATFTGLDAGANTEFVPVLNDTDLTLTANFATGPSIVDAFFDDGIALGTPPFVEVTFSEPVNRNSFNATDLVLTGPSGVVPLPNPSRVNFDNARYRVFLGNDPLESGSYTLVIGPDVQDFVGNPMNQDGDGNNGEAIDDVFTFNFDLNLPDLAVDSVTVDSAATFGDTLDVDWIASNNGNVDASGTWTDRVYLSTDATLDNGDLQLADVTTNAFSPLAPGTTYENSATIVLPIDGSLPDGTYFILVETDAANNVPELNEQNNVTSRSIDLTVPPLPNLTINPTVVPANFESGSTINLEWDTTNSGTASTAGGWTDRVFLSTDATLSNGDRLLAEVIQSIPLGIGETRSKTEAVQSPIDLFGDDFFFIFVTDANDDQVEHAGENDNIVTSEVDIVLGPIADLTVRDVMIDPALAIGEPPIITVDWTVDNIGTGAGVDLVWEDVIYISADNIFGNFGDREIARFSNPNALNTGESYSRSETITLNGVTGEFHLFVQTDGDDAVFENGEKANNFAEANNILQAMPIPFADLIISNVAVPGTAQSGTDIDVTWTVTNQGIGLTSSGSWTDSVFLATDAAGNDLILDNQGDPVKFNFTHFGPIAPGEGYNRTGSIAVPDGFDGDLFIVVEAAAKGGPFEFNQLANNTTVSAAIPVTLSPSPDLTVTDIIAPNVAQDGDVIDVTWTVTNQGGASADGVWVDLVFLEDTTNPDEPVLLGQFTRTGPLGVGENYTRTEALTILDRTNGEFQLFVVTNHTEAVFEDDRTNNQIADDTTIDVSLRPRADVFVSSVTIPADVDAGSTLSLDFTITNQGTAPTEPGTWIDELYLSLDGSISNDDILIGSIANGASLAPGESYVSSVGPINVPLRFRGSMFVLINPDAENKIDEFPDDNNLHLQPIFVNPQPLADLVISDIILPSQATAGAEIEISYTLTNRGSGPMNTGSVLEQIWLTIDKNRPSPLDGDVLLATFLRNDLLDVNQGVDRTVTITVPQNIPSGVFHVTPWADPFGAVLEDTLAINVNPDDPNELDNNNYKAAELPIIGSLPDLTVKNVLPSQTTAVGGDLINVSWAIENEGTGIATGGFVTSVYLTDNVDPLADGARSLLLGQAIRDQPLGVNESAIQAINVTLSPSAQGQFIAVVVDDAQKDIDEDFNAVEEVFEDNNFTSVAVDYTSLLADLVVTNVEFIGDLQSGEDVTIRYTVENQGANPIWEGTEFWRDFLWIGRSDEFIRLSSSFLGTHVQGRPGPLNPGDSYVAEFQTTLPRGLDGDYNLYIHLAAHNDRSPLFFPLEALILDPSFFPADQGSNARFLEEFRRWPFEDPSNNLHVEPVAIEFFEPDLRVTDVVIPGGIESGKNITIDYTVINEGTRATRSGSHKDRFFLSLDESLDNLDLEVGVISISGGVDVGETYTRTVTLNIPVGIDGDFFLLSYTDSAAEKDTFKLGPESNIGFNQPGTKFETLNTLFPFNIADVQRRSLSRGDVEEFQNEGDNIFVSAMPVTLSQAPDLQVTDIIAPLEVFAGQEFDVTVTVQNFGGPIPITEEDFDNLIYLSRDDFLDLKADTFLGDFEREGVLAANESFSFTLTLQAPTNKIGDFELFAITDPVRSNKVVGKVFEDLNERNNDQSVSITINQPPPVDLVVLSNSIVTIPTAAKAGDAILVQWTGQNVSDETVMGKWSDAVFLSTDETWDIGDARLGRAEFSGTLNAGDTYDLTLNSFVPPTLPGQYFLIVRTDIFNQVFEGTDENNNITASDSTLDVSVDVIQLGVPFDTTLSTGQDRLFEVAVPANETLRVTLTGSDENQINELFLGQDFAPRSTNFDATYEGGLNSTVVSTLPSTEDGKVFILVRGNRQPADDTPVNLIAELLPLSITDVSTDVGGDSRFVTTTIRGAKFDPDAVVTLVRPGFGEFSPASFQVIDATKIIASFDFTDASRGLYDVKVTNPDGSEVIVPYRFLVERAVQPDVTIGVGGPRIILAGDVGNYSVALQGVGNLDTPYVFFSVGIPEMGQNLLVYNLNYQNLTTNVAGAPPNGGFDNVTFANLNSSVNTTGHLLASGYLFDQQAFGFDGFNFNLETYPGLRELNERNFEALVERLHQVRPDLKELGIPATPEQLDLVQPGLFALYKAFGTVPDFITENFIPFQTHVVASATAMTRDEFIAHTLSEAEPIRQAILNDPNAVASLVALAADKVVWETFFLASLEEAGLLRPDGEAPPIRENALVVSLMATLASGILVGPAGEDVLATNSILSFFDALRTRYGHNPDLEAPTSGVTDPGGNPIPILPEFEDFDLGLTTQTHFQAFNVYVPWIKFEDRGGGLPPDFQISGVDFTDEDAVLANLDLRRFFAGDAAVTGVASITAPTTIESSGFLPSGKALPYTVNFQNDPSSSSHTHEVRVVVDLDENLDTRTFRLGDVRIGNINIDVPNDRGVFQGDFDFIDTLGFIVRVSAGVDLASNEATWLIQAIDPLTGDVISDPNRGLLPPNNALGDGFGFVTYTITTDDDVVSGDTIDASARVFFDNAAPEDTQTISQTIDAEAPTTTLDVQRIGTTPNFKLTWSAVDDTDGSGVKHVTLFVAENGGDFKVFQRQIPNATGSDVFIGQPGISYEFLALATDVAGNQEVPPLGLLVPDDGSGVNLGFLPDVEQTPPNFGIAPEPAADPSTNPLFTAAEFGEFAAIPPIDLSEFDDVLRPFTGRAFATGITQSHANIGPMAIAQRSDGTVFISGGADRNELFVVSEDGAPNGVPAAIATLPHPIFNLAFDSADRLWATTGGGPLLQLNPDTGAVIGTFGAGLTIALAVQPGTDRVFVSSNGGVEVFDPATQTFTRFSRDEDLRVGSLAFASDGSLWGTTWPDRRSVVKFNDRARAEVMLSFESDIDSIAFGQAGTRLDGLLFVSHNTGERNSVGAVELETSELTMVDVTTLRQVGVAIGGTRGDALTTTNDGRLLISQSNQVDVLKPVEAPLVVAVDPADGSTVDIALSSITVTFSEDMFVGNGDELQSVINPLNYTINGAINGAVAVTDIDFDVNTSTAVLTIGSLAADQFTFSIDNVESIDRLGLEEPFVSTFTVEVIVVNEPPVAVLDHASLLEDGTITFSILANDSDANGDINPSSVAITTQPTNGSLSVDPVTGVATFTPDEHFSGSDSFIYTVADFEGNLSNEATVKLAVAPVADAPLISAALTQGVQDTALAIDIDASLVDTDGSETLSIELSGVPVGSVLSAGNQVSDDTFVLTPDELVGLTLTPPSGSAGNFTLAATAIATEQANGDTAETTVLLPLSVAAVVVPDVELLELVVNNGEAQRSVIHTLSLVFNQNVFIGDPSSAVQIVPRGGTPALSLDASRFNYDSATNTLNVDVDGLITANDEYRINLDRSAITSFAARNAIMIDNDANEEDGVVSIEFLRKLADFTGNGLTDNLDLFMFRSHYRTIEGQPGYDPLFDLDTDGVVSRLDLLLFRNEMFQRSPDVYGPDLGAALLNDTGRFDSDGVTSDATVSGLVTDLTGIDSLLGGIDGTPAFDLSGLVNADGTFTFDAATLDAINGSTLIDGVHTLTLVATDQNGFASDPFDLVFTLDRTAPTAPLTPELLASSDTGSSDSDNLTRLSTIDVSTSSEAGAIVRFFVDGNLASQGTNGSDVTVTLVDLDEGTRNITANAEDLAGNTSVVSPGLNVTIDRTPPTAPAFGIENDTDNRTSSDMITLAGVTEPSAMVRLLETGQTASADGTGIFTFTNVSLNLGNNVFTVEATDASGNSNTVANNIIRTGPETDAPIINAGLVNDTGIVGDLITNNPTIVGTVTDASDVTVLRAGLNSAPTTNTLGVLSGNVFTLSPAFLEVLNGGSLIDGQHTLRLFAQDEFLNASAVFEFTFTLKTQVPTAPATPDLVADSDLGANQDDNVTSNPTPTITVETNDDAVVRLHVDDGTNEGIADEQIAVDRVATFNVNLPDGIFDISADVVDDAGNVSNRSDTLTITISTVAPSAPTLDLDPAFDTAPIGDQSTDLEQVRLIGTADPNVTVQLLRDGAVIRQAMSDTNGQFAFDNVALAIGPNNFTAVAMDIAGNTAAFATTITSTAIDATAPSIDALLANDTGRSNSDGVTFDPTIVGSIDDASAITEFRAGINGGPTSDVLASLTGKSFTFTEADLDALADGNLADGSHTLRLEAIDANGLGSNTFELDFTLDTLRPFRPGDPDLIASDDTGFFENDNITNKVDVTLQGNAEANSLLTLFVEGVAVDELLINGGPTDFAVTLSEGVNRISARAEDLAGNRSIFSNLLLVNLDTVAPDSPLFGLDESSDTRPFADNATILENVRLIGNAEVDTRLVLLETGAQVNPESDGSFAFKRIVLPTLGQHEFNVESMDLAGNVTIGTTFIDRVDFVDADIIRPEVTLTVSNATNTAGDSVTLTALVADNVGVVDTELFINGESVALIDEGGGAFSATFVSDGAGFFEATAISIDPAGNRGQAGVDFVYFLNPIITGDTAAPTAIINSSDVTGSAKLPADLLGTADDANFLRYTLELAPQGTEDFQVIAVGDAPVLNDILGVFDPTTLQNGFYISRLTVVDTSGNTATAERLLQAQGAADVGVFTVSFLDAALPAAGVPLSATRTYDSRKRNDSGDFGFGWNLDIDSMTVNAANVLGDGGFTQAITQIQGLNFVGFQNTKDVSVNVTLPDGQVERFILGFSGFITEAANPAPLTQTKLFFRPLVGTTTKLEALADNVVDVVPGELGPITFRDRTTGDIYNPTRFKLTLRNGSFFILNTDVGIESMTDANGNTLTFGMDAFTHSNGRALDIQRDAEGRVTSITDPTGAATLYEYDFYGDLIGVTDAEGNTTRFTYDENHVLLEVFDPLGRRGQRNEYDDSGRLIASIDGAGHRVEYDHDLEGQQEIVEDRKGNKTVRTYDENGFVTSTTDALGNTTNYVVDEFGNTLAIIDALGNTTAYSYDQNNNMLTRTDGLGNTTSWTYNALGLVTSVTDPLGNVSANTFDSKGNLLTATDALGNSANYAYDLAGNRTSATDALGNQTQWGYDSFGNTTSHTDAVGNVTAFTYDDGGRQLSVIQQRTDGDGNLRVMSVDTVYDTLGRTTEIFDVFGNSATVDYTEFGEVASKVSQNGRSVSYSYDIRGNRVRGEYDDGTFEVWNYDANGNISSFTTRFGTTTQYEFDALNRATRVVYPDDTEVFHEYDAIGRVTARIDSDGNRTEIEYDTGGRFHAAPAVLSVVRDMPRVSNVTDGNGNVVSYEYDGNGNATQIIAANGETITPHYDALNRQTSVTLPGGLDTEQDYDAIGRVSRIESADGLGVTYVYDNVSRITEVIDADGNSTNYVYDEASNIISATDPNGRTTSWTYDDAGQKISRTLPMGMTESWTYNNDGTPATHTDFNGDTISFTYDDFQRMLSKTYEDGSTVIFTRTEDGLIDTVTDSRGDTQYFYDDADRLTQVTNPDGTSVSYAYNSIGALDSVTSLSGTTTYEYDGVGVLDAVIDSQGRRTEYVEADNAAIVVYANGTTQETTIDELQRVTSSVIRDADGNVLESYNYTFDVAAKTRTATESNGRSVTFTYDDLGRLIQEAIVDPVNGDETIDYTYDAFANRETKTDSTGTTTYTYDLNDRLISEASSFGTVTYVYDDNGNLLSSTDGADVTTYVYDFDDRLVQVNLPTGDVIDYEYDHQNSRVSRSVNGDRTNFLVDSLLANERVLDMYDDSGDVSASYTFGLNLISQENDDGLSYYHHDAFLDTRLLTDAFGDVSDTYSFDAFGNLLASTGGTDNPFLYAGEFGDLATGLIHLRARELDPRTGRFLQLDPAAGIPTAPVTLNKYVYANSDPTTYQDPSGEIAGLFEGLRLVNTLISLSAMLSTAVGVTAVAITGVGNLLVNGADLTGFSVTHSTTASIGQVGQWGASSLNGLTVDVDNILAGDFNQSIFVFDGYSVSSSIVYGSLTRAVHAAGLLVVGLGDSISVSADFNHASPGVAATASVGTGNVSLDFSVVIGNNNSLVPAIPEPSLGPSFSVGATFGGPVVDAIASVVGLANPSGGIINQTGRAQLPGFITELSSIQPTEIVLSAGVARTYENAMTRRITNILFPDQGIQQHELLVYWVGGGGLVEALRAAGLL